MRRDKIEMYVHLLWTTWDREPLILPVIEKKVHSAIAGGLKSHGCEIIGLNGVADHVHVLVKMPSTATLCKIVKDAKDAKGASSREANLLVGNFKWRPTYAAFSVSQWDVEMIKGYIARQKSHHQYGTIEGQLEEFDEEFWFSDKGD